MHVRLSTVLGLPILDDGSDERLGVLSSILLNPDTGVVEGLFVSQSRMPWSEVLFVSSLDVIHWGTHIRVRDDALSPLSERFRLQQMVEEGRTILHQRIVTEEGTVLGMCRDVQFNTKLFTLEWLFPRKFLRWGRAVPASAIVEVKREAVIVKNASLTVDVRDTIPVLQTLEV